MKSKSSARNKQFVKVKRDKLQPCLTCHICSQILNDVTTISECLHKFCRKCIHDKIVNEDLNHCPECNVDLGTSPLDKLRKDNNYQNIVTTICKNDPKNSDEMHNSKAKEVVESQEIVQSKKKDEPIISSLLDHLPKIKTHSVTTRKRSKVICRKPTPSQATSSKPSSGEASLKTKQTDENGRCEFTRLSLVCELNKHSTIVNEHLSKSTLANTSKSDDQSTISMPLLKKNENYKSNAKGSKNLAFNSTKKQSKNTDAEIEVGKATPRKLDLNKLPINPKITNVSSHSNKNENIRTSEDKGKEIIIIDDDDDDDDCVYLGCSKGAPINECDKSDNIIVPKCKGKGKVVVPPSTMVLRSSSKSVKKNNNQGKHQMIVKKADQQVKEASVTPNLGGEKFTTKRPDGLSTQLWFSLKSADNQEGCAPLPQLPLSYINVNDGRITISKVKEYIAKKFNLADESEVEIMLNGIPVVSPSLKLCNLLDVWRQDKDKRPQQIHTHVGSSAPDDVVMVLTYARKIASP